MTVFPVVKDPQADKDYEINWADPAAVGGPFLTNGDTIVASTWTIYLNTNSGSSQVIVTGAPGIVVASSSFTTTTTTVWLTGGVVVTEYLVVNHITTAQGRQEDQTIIMLCINT